MPGVLPLSAPLPLSGIQIDRSSYGIPRTARADRRGNQHIYCFILTCCIAEETAGVTELER